MFGKSDWHSPFIRLSDVTLTYDTDPVEGMGQRSNLQQWQDLR